ncbi:Hypothetical_protein [Hexamita inflata]|uniref:Hypothetical_protein n=1 Tax=Hexamita inflata TaxID=28002 RepID=A0AA86UZX0_9EUKA|nr:Hypothetical protein HINF_LOCUS41463 [Hexamita inflata]
MSSIHKVIPILKTQYLCSQCNDAKIFVQQMCTSERSTQKLISVSLYMYWTLEKQPPAHPLQEYTAQKRRSSSCTRRRFVFMRYYAAVDVRKDSKAAEVPLRHLLRAYRIFVCFLRLYSQRPSTQTLKTSIQSDEVAFARYRRFPAFRIYLWKLFLPYTQCLLLKTSWFKRKFERSISVHKVWAEVNTRCISEKMALYSILKIAAVKMDFASESRSCRRTRPAL